MKLYNYYFLKKIAGYFLVIIASLACLIWFSKAVMFIKYITDNGIKFSQFLYLFALVLPWLLLFTIPISLFIAILTVYNRMITSNEIAIFKNSGLSKLDLAKPAIIIASLCCLICYFISFYLMPMANKELRILKNNFANNYFNLVISPGIFETLNNMTIYVKDRNEKNKLSGIIVYDNHNRDYSLTLTAKDGDIIQDRNLLMLKLENGTAQRFNFTTQKSEILKFDSYLLNLSSDSKKTDKFVWKAQERYIWELFNPEEDRTAEELSKYIIEINQRIIYPTFSLILTIIAVAFVLRGQFKRIGNNFNNLIAVIFAVLFIASIMVIFDSSEKRLILAPLAYLDLLLFAICGFYILKSDNL